jgi:hypothetical protein
VRRSLVIALASLVAVMVGAAPVLAGGENIGKVGAWRLRDTASKPGVTCYYDASSELLTSVFIRAPKMWARDVTASRDRQKVGWRYFIKRLEGPESVPTVYKSPIMTARAYDDQPAAFQGVHHALTIDGNSDPHFVAVKLFWYRNGSIEGKTLQQELEHYQATIEGSGVMKPLTDRGRCPVGYED